MILEEVERLEGGKDSEMGWQSWQRIASLGPADGQRTARLRARLRVRRAKRAEPELEERRLLVQPFLPQPAPAPIPLHRSRPLVYSTHDQQAQQAAATAPSDAPVHAFDIETASQLDASASSSSADLLGSQHEPVAAASPVDAQAPVTVFPGRQQRGGCCA
jgi:hypothetical protein